MGADSTEYRAELVGALPANLADIKNTSRGWKVTGIDDRVWTFATFSAVKANPRTYNIASRPTAMNQRDGCFRGLNYAADGKLTSIVDSFGRTAAFGWYMFYSTSILNKPGYLPLPGRHQGKLSLPPRTCDDSTDGSGACVGGRP